MNAEKLQTLLKQARLLAVPEKEKNIFSLGGKGHYENPISDLLVFFLDKRQCHGLDDLIVKSLSQALSVDIEQSNTPQREVVTDDNKRIDILFEGNNYVTVIENKIRHWAANPFESYLAHVNQYYPNKKSLFILLSVRKEIAPKGWVALTYSELFDCIKNNLGEYIMRSPSSKWLVLFREFMLNIEQEAGVELMSNERFEFVRTNYQTVLDIKKMFDEYLVELTKKVEAIIRLNNDKTVSSKQGNWGEYTPALRFYCASWGKETNIVLVVNPNGLLNVHVYVYNIADEQVSALREIIDSETTKRYWTEKSETIHGFNYFTSDDLNAVLAEISNVAKKLDYFYA